MTRRVARLALRVRGRPCEPAVGLLARLARRHGAERLGPFADWIGFPIGGLAKAGAVDALAAAADVDADELRRHTARHDAPNRHVRLAGEAVRRLDWSDEVRRWCPACIAHDVALADAAGVDAGAFVSRRSWWDVVAILACPLHDLELVDACSICGATQGVDAFPFHRCGCGASLHSIGRRPRGRRASDAFLHARLTGGEVPDLGPLSDEPLHRVVPTLRWLGLCATTPWNSRWPRTSDCLDPVEEGARIARDWPNAFVAALDEGLGRADARTARSGMLAYGWVYEQFGRSLGEGIAADAIRAELRGHAVRAGRISAEEPILGSAGKGGVMGLVEAANVMGCGFASARRMLGEGRHVPNGSRRGVRTCLDRRTVLAMAARRRTCLDLNGVARRLGVGRGTAREIVRSGLLEEAAVDVPGASRTYDRRRIASIVERIPPGGSIRSASGSPASAVDLAAATRASGLDVPSLLEHVRRGRLRPLRWPSNGHLGSALFGRSDVVALRSSAAAGTLGATARELGLHPEAALALATSGLLIGTRTATAWRFAVEDVRAFREEFVTATELARTVGVSPKALAERVRQASVRPAAGPPTCRQLVYRRAEVPADVLACRDVSSVEHRRGLSASCHDAIDVRSAS